MRRGDRPRGSRTATPGRRPQARARATVLAACALFAGGLAVMVGVRAGASADTPVDLALVLAIDCSYSVDAREFGLQTEGMADAFDHPAVRGAIRSGPTGRIAVAVVQWSGADDQALAVPWTIVGTDDEIDRLARRIRLLPRVSEEGATSITGMIDYARVLFAGLDAPTERRTLDIVADGINNIGGWTRPARDRALREGITINGLAIENEVFYLRHWFRNHVIGGANAFVLDVDGYEDFAPAFRVKLIREIRPEIL